MENQFKSFKPRRYSRDKKYLESHPADRKLFGHMMKEICANCGNTFGEHFVLNCK
jgi:hypothetical protein